MDTKEAIERIENAYSVIESENWVGKEEKEVLENEKNNVITLLKQGEKFGKMWEEIQETEYPSDVDFSRIEDKYFPKSKKEDRPIKMERMDHMEKGMADIFGLKKHFPKPKGGGVK